MSPPAPNTEWKPISGFRVLHQPPHGVQRAAGWMLLGILLLIWGALIAQAMLARRGPGAVAWLLIILLPAAVLGMWALLRFFNRGTLRRLETLGEKLGLETRCRYGPPLWLPTFPELLGTKHAQQIWIQYTSGRRSRVVTLTIQGPRTDTLTDNQVSNALAESGVTLLKCIREPGRIILRTRGNLLAERTCNWLTAMLDLIAAG